MKRRSLAQRADSHHNRGGNDASWIAGYRACRRDGRINREADAASNYERGRNAGFTAGLAQVPDYVRNLQRNCDAAHAECARLRRMIDAMAKAEHGSNGK